MISKSLVRSLLSIKEKVDSCYRPIEDDSPNYDEAVSLSCISAAIEEYLENYFYNQNS